MVLSWIFTYLTLIFVVPVNTCNEFVLRTLPVYHKGGLLVNFKNDYCLRILETVDSFITFWIFFVTCLLWRLKIMSVLMVDALTSLRLLHRSQNPSTGRQILMWPFLLMLPHCLTHQRILSRYITQCVLILRKSVIGTFNN